MKVLFLIQGHSLPSSRVRVLDLIPDLRLAGIEAEVLPYPKRLREKLRMLVRCSGHEIVVLQKKLPTLPDLLLLRWACRRLVYDFDDAVFFRHDDSRGHDHPTGRRRFQNLVARTDLVIAGNRFLARAAAARGARVEILPSAVEVRGVPTRDHPDRPESFVIGWVGGGINLRYAASLGPTLRELSRELPLEYRIICSEGLSIEGVRTTFVPWSQETQAAEIAKFDMGVMPLPQTPHAEGKCAYKALQYMAAGVPPVVSDVGVNRDVVADSGRVAASPEEFMQHFRELAADAPLRRDLGGRARRLVEGAYSVEVVAQRLADLLKSLGETSTKPTVRPTG
jgi:hypothetical protein